MPADFSAHVAVPNQSLTEQVQRLIDQLRAELALAAEQEETLAATMARVNTLQTQTIPDVMGTIEELKLADGSVLKVKPGLNASVSEDNRPAAFTWLREQGHGAVIKTMELIDVQGLDAKQQKRLYDLFEKAGIEHEAKAAVHPQTLKALCKELLEQGMKLPPCFSIHEYKKATVTTLKGKK